MSGPSMYTFPPRSNQFQPSSSPNRRFFTYLVGTAFFIASLGLMANLFYLKTLNAHDGYDYAKEEQFFLPYTRLNRKLPDVRPKPPSTPSVFQRMQKESIQALEQCQAVTTMSKHDDVSPSTQVVATTKLRRRLQQEGTPESSSLPPFGLVNALRKVSTTRRDDSPKLSSASSCLREPPPPTSCQTQTYSAIITSDARNLGTLFRNVMSWLTYKNLRRTNAVVVVVLPLDTQLELQQDPLKYGRRLWDWHQDPTHPVKLIFCNSIWDALSSSRTEGNDSTDGIQRLFSSPDAEAVLFLNGDMEAADVTLNEGGMQAGFQLWKQSSDRVVLSEGTQLVVVVANEQTNETSNDDDSGSVVPICRQDKVLLSTNPDDSSLSLARPSSSSTTTTILASLHGTFVHRNYICLASQDVLSKYRSVAEELSLSDTSDATTTAAADPNAVALSILLQRLSGHAPLTFPYHVLTASEEEQLQHNEAQRFATTTTRRGRRLLQVGETPSPPSSEDGVRSSSSTDLTTLIGYFGSFPVGSIRWCADDGITCPTRARKQELSWMQHTWCTEETGGARGS